MLVVSAGFLLSLVSAITIPFGSNNTGLVTNSTGNAASVSVLVAGSNGTSANAAVAGIGGTPVIEITTVTVPFDPSTVVPVIIKIGIEFTTILQAPAYTQTAYASSEDQPAWVNLQTIAVLAPVIPSFIDTSDPVHFEPSIQTTIQYATTPEGVAVQRDFSNIDLDFHHPAVVIDHTDYIVASYAGPNVMELQFTNAQAVQYAATQWLPAGQAAVVLVAFLPGSPDYNLGGNTYFTAVSIVCNIQQLKCTVQGIDGGAESAVKHFDAEFGKDVVPLYSDTKTGSKGLGTSRPVVSTNGLPSCAFGDDFDDCLDRQLGYIDFKSDLAAGVNEIAPGATLDDTSFLLDKRDFAKRQMISDYKESRLNKRCCSWFKKAFRSIKNAVQRYVVEPVKKVVQVVKNTIQELTSIDRTLETKKSLQFPPTDYTYDTSPFIGKAISITQGDDLSAWCVDCGTSGSVTIAGRLAANLIQGFTQAYIGISGSIAAEVNIGIDAKKAFKRTYKKKLAEVGVPGLSVQPFYRVGPALIFEVEADFGLELQSQFLAGARVEINNFEARVDALRSSNSFQRNFSPVFTKRFEAKGQVKGSVDIGLPVSIAFGIDVLSGKFKRDIALVEKPGVHLDAAIALYASATEAPRLVTINGCKGVDTNVNLFNKVYAVVGTSSYPIFDFAVPVAKSCFQIAGVEDAPSSATVQQEAPDTPFAADTGPQPQATTDAAPQPQTSTDTSPQPQPQTTTNPSPEPQTTTNPSPEPQTTTEPATQSSSQVSAEASPEPQLPVAKRQQQSASGAAPAPSSSAGGGGTVTVGRLEDLTTFNASDSLDGYTLPTDLLSKSTFNSSAAAGLNLTADETLVRIVNKDNQLLWLSDPDGNFYLEEVANAGQNAGLIDFFLDDEELIIANPREQYMFFYDDEMNKLGVSRLRTNIDSLTPKTATLLSFQSIDYGDGVSAIGALDNQQNIFYVITCDIPSRGTMLFVAKDPTSGATTLMSDAVQSSITGGKVTECYYLDYSLVKTTGV
ncbi:hypothetical protein BCR37DRAFT_389301 [Protomyces lactucae-debilis]|uniref:DUF7223 domain-containing protein n=1 Tax=Protomyces lactucae-debilis TaxID=2754530 RepID=A0A1Y2F120_PROLT|nr:uncharacterized protein BCR37DRAFT_389301 [Protomyces lactucae-debilis]ORY77046.1 hypothetical protein BCR37DRAFT_389301 [Protomyces lactucae-debilis]